MNNEILANINSFRAIVGITVIIYAYAWSLAWASGNKHFQDNNSFCMVRLSKPIAFILFLRFFNRKISLWAILMQVTNLLTLIASIIVYYILQENFGGSVASKVFGWIHVINLYGITILIGIDILLYRYKEWKKNR